MENKFEIKFNEAENHLYVVGEEEFHDETAFGEPSCWISLPNGRNIEVTHEEYGLEKPYFSVRLHSSEDEYNNMSEDVLHTIIADDIVELNSCAIPKMIKASENIIL